MISLRVNNSGLMPWYYSIKHFNMFIIDFDFAACLKTLKMLPKLMITHPEDQEVSAKEDLRLIVILLDRQCVATSVWVEQWKEQKKLIRLVLTYFESQQSFKDQLKHILKHEFYHKPKSTSHRWRQSCSVERMRVPSVNFLTQNRL